MEGEPDHGREVEGTPRAPAPSRDDTWLRTPADAAEPTSTPQPTPAPQPPPKRSFGREFAVRALVTLGVLAVVAVPRLIDGKGGEAEQGAAPPVDDAEVREYLSEIQRICHKQNQWLAADKVGPVDELIRSESRATSRMAAVPSPPQARDIRRALLRQRRIVLRGERWMYRVMTRAMARGENPNAAYREIVEPTLTRQVGHHYRIFDNFGVNCSKAP
jgi:hypothetical protein